MFSCSPGENASKEARFVWHSADKSCVLYCAPASRPNSPIVISATKVYKPVAFRNKDVDYWKYTAETSKLRPDTEYVYWVKSPSETSRRHRFKTGGTKGQCNFLWMSDVHANPGEPDKMKTVELLLKNGEELTSSSKGLDFVLFSGDATKFGSRYDNWQQWNSSRVVTDYMFAMVPGNKEYYLRGRGTFNDYNWYLAVRNNPPNGPSAKELEGCYWFIRDGVMFVGIDSMVSKGKLMARYGDKANVLKDQTEWFDRVVSMQRGKFKYLVVFQHDPWFVYAKSKDEFDKSRGYYDAWRNVFDKHKVDLALSGDEHNYIRTKPLRGDKAAKDGTIYLVAGQIEAKNYGATVTSDIRSIANANVQKYIDCLGVTDASCGACLIEVRPNALKLTYFWNRWQEPKIKIYDTVTVAPKKR